MNRLHIAAVLPFIAAATAGSLAHADSGRPAATAATDAIRRP